jgi:hypothetical protein
MGLCALVDAVDAHRAADVLHAVLAEIDKADRQFFADLVAHGAADANVARLGKRL